MGMRTAATPNVSYIWSLHNLIFFLRHTLFSILFTSILSKLLHYRFTKSKVKWCSVYINSTLHSIYPNAVKIPLIPNKPLFVIHTNTVKITKLSPRMEQSRGTLHMLKYLTTSYITDANTVKITSLPHPAEQNTTWQLFLMSNYSISTGCRSLRIKVSVNEIMTQQIYRWTR